MRLNIFSAIVYAMIPQKLKSFRILFTIPLARLTRRKTRQVVAIATVDSRNTIELLVKIPS